MRHISEDRFEELVADALESLPNEFLDRLENVAVTVSNEPSAEQIQEYGLGPDETLFGLYEGVPLTDRDSYGDVLPDRITIFQRPLELYCDDEKELEDEVRMTVAHEIAHHFGIGDDRLRELGL